MQTLIEIGILLVLIVNTIGVLVAADRAQACQRRLDVLLEQNSRRK